MVKRRPHTIVVKGAGQEIVDGELSEGTPLELTIENVRFDYTSNLKRKENGDEVEISGKIYTNHDKITDATHVVFNDEEYRIVEWKAFQSHSLIYVAR